MRHLILTSTQAARVRGATAKGAALDPVALTDGTFALPEAVLTDPAHAQHASRLKALPIRSVSDSEFQWRADAEAQPLRAKR